MSDQAARLHAVDPGRSVIVQAPAGSGKTTLLVERYLALLAVVDSPEEILAITFTRKAAAEMRERVLRFLDPAFDSDAPHEQAALSKARAIEDKVREWGLLENPQRLLIRTIDSFNQYLARTMPVASQLGPVPSPADDARALYREAARRTLDGLNRNDALSQDLARLLRWRDHRSQDIEDLLLKLLGQREQWLRALGQVDAVEKVYFEQTLHDLVSEHLALARTALDQALSLAGTSERELLDILAQAGDSAKDLSKATPYEEWPAFDRLPGPTPDDLPGWRMLGFALLTNGGTWRASLNKNYGFPPKSPHKSAMEALLEQWSDNEDLAALIDTARSLPVPRYAQDEWQVLASLIRVLHHAAAELALLFAERGRSDFADLGDAALRGLGDEAQGYTDLALYLDQRIQHILVDEYQDTNWGQYHLLEKLLGGWQENEARSLFLVGDPMQSIYRFREAEVGLFVRTREQGIGAVRLESCQLSRNFRSRAEIVSWVNDRIGPTFPQREDVAAGAVRYARSEAGRDSGGVVEVVALPDRVSEAEALAQRVETLLDQHQDQEKFSAAIIVRARSHLAELLPALARRDIPYRAVRLDPLLSRPVALDLLSITRLVLNPADRSARLALLRSPLCGLSLDELHALAGDDKNPLDDDALGRLSEQAHTRARRVYEAIDDASQLRGRLSVRDRVEGVFKRLGGPELITRTATDQRDARSFLATLEQAENERQLSDWNAFMELLSAQQTEGDPADDSVRLEILTMHGAKGLEWDAVILPALERGPRTGAQELLYWLPFTPESGQEQVLLAPLRSATQTDNNALIKLIQSQRQQRDAYEQQRLLYVAATRARERLILSAVIDSEKEAPKPRAGSLLDTLWPSCEGDFLAALQATGEASIDAAVLNKTNTSEETPKRVRVAEGWRPEFGSALEWKAQLPAKERQVEIKFSWQNIQARRIGTVLHRVLEEIGRVGLENFDEQRLDRLRSRIPGLLRAMGTGQSGLAESVEIIQSAIDRTLASDQGRWILSGKHPQHACELALTGIIDGQLVNAVIDRTFVDRDGMRWIIDYKSGHAEDDDIDAFLQREAEQYREQLATYRTLFEQMGESQVRVALYLPRLDRLQAL